MLSGVGPNFEGHVQGGFTTNGRTVSGLLEVFQSFGAQPVFVGYQDTMYTVWEITNDGWHYNKPVSGGSLSLATQSGLIKTLADTTSNKSGFFLQLGPIADQTFANGSDSTAALELYIGGDDYSAIFNTTGRTVMSVQADSQGLY